MSTFKKLQDIGVFRPSYGNLYGRFLVTNHAPILLMSATCRPKALDAIKKNLRLGDHNLRLLTAELVRTEIRLIRMSSKHPLKSAKDLRFFFWWCSVDTRCQASSNSYLFWHPERNGRDLKLSQHSTWPTWELTERSEHLRASIPCGHWTRWQVRSRRAFHQITFYNNVLYYGFGSRAKLEISTPSDSYGMDGSCGGGSNVWPVWPGWSPRCWYFIGWRNVIGCWGKK